MHYLITAPFDTVRAVQPRLTRAHLLSSGVRTGTALLLTGSAFGAMAAAADATPPSDALGVLPAGDLAYARLLSAWELLMIDFYTHALGSGHLDRAAGDVVRLALANEQGHYDYLAGVFTAAGAVPLTSADIDFTYPTGAFYTARSVLRLAVTLEGSVLGTYLGAAGNVATPALASAITQMTVNEAQHLSVLSLRVGTAAFQDAFPATMTMEDSSNALDSFTS
jgi:hypothetical protein